MPDNGLPASLSVLPQAVRFRALGPVDLQRTGVGELRELLVQPKRLALFAYLVLSRPARLHRRDSLMALFWPESDGAAARRSLRQALHFMRQRLGTTVLVNRGFDEVGVDFETVWCDVHEFERELDASRPDDALGLYRGALLDGFHVAAVAPELGQWLDAERARLHLRAIGAASERAEHAERAGNATLAVQRLRDLLRLDPGAEPVLRRLMTLLDRAGDRSGALRVYDEFARHLAADVGARPSHESAALAERIRRGRDHGGAARRTPPPLDVPIRTPRPEGAMDPTPRSRPSTQGAASRRRTRWQVIAVLVLAAAAIGAVTLLR